MALSDFEAERYEVKLKKGSFSVRGLSLADISTLLHKHTGHIDRMGETFAKNADSIFSKTSGTNILLSVVKDFPEVTNSVIALCSDEPDQEDNVGKLPLGTQIEALTHVVRLTFEEAGGPKALWSTLKTLFGGLGLEELVGESLAGLKKILPSSASTGDSGKT